MFVVMVLIPKKYFFRGISIWCHMYTSNTGIRSKQVNLKIGYHLQAVTLDQENAPDLLLVGLDYWHYAALFILHERTHLQTCSRGRNLGWNLYKIHFFSSKENHAEYVKGFAETICFGLWWLRMSTDTPCLCLRCLFK